MQAMKSTLSDRQAVWAFVLGWVAVTADVRANLPVSRWRGRQLGHAAL